MKRKQRDEFRSKSSPELVLEIKKREEELLKLSMEIKMAKVKNTSSLRIKADELAILKTLLKEKTEDKSK